MVGEVTSLGGALHLDDDAVAPPEIHVARAGVGGTEALERRPGRHGVVGPGVGADELVQEGLGGLALGPRVGGPSLHEASERGHDLLPRAGHR